MNTSKRWAFRRLLLVFFVLRLIELAVLVIGAALLDALHGLLEGIPVQFSVIGPLLTAAGFYFSFAYIAVSAVAFFFLWLSGRTALIPVANVVPLLAWGAMALTVVFGLDIPLTLMLALVLAAIANFFAAKWVQSKGHLS